MDSKLRLSSRLLLSAVLFSTAAACSGEAPSDGTPPATTPPVTSTTPPGTTPPAADAKLPPPISGGTLLLLADGRAAVASDPDRDRIYVVDLIAKRVRATLPLAQGAEPGRVIEDSEGRAHVALRGGGAIVSLDPRDGRLLATREVCPAPRGLAFDSGRNLLHVACAGGEFVSIAPLAEAPARTLQLDRDLRDVLVQGDKILVSTFRKAELLVVGDAGVVERLSPPRVAPAFNNLGRGKGIPGMIPGIPGTSGDGLANAAVAWRLLAGPGQTAMMLHQRGVDGEIGTTPSAYGGGSCAGVVEATVTAFEPGTTAGALRTAGALGNAVVAVDMAVSPDGKQLAVVSAGNFADQQLIFYSTETTMKPAPERPCEGGSTVPPMGTMPPSPPDDGMGDPIEYRPPNGQVIAVVYDKRGNILVQSREPASLQILTQRVDPIVLATERKADLGHQVFHAATKGKLACASCHPDGGEDGLTWEFVGLGARRTQSLRGGILDTAPFHWNGDMTSLDHLMHDVFEGRMSGAQLDRERVQSLGRWLDQVPTIKPSRWHAAEMVDRGKALFEGSAAACTTCHKGADFTNGGSFDVGTGGSFQVPQLHNLAFRAPFMHNGCAKTLADRFTGAGCGGDDRHGLTSKLNQAQIADLIAYLESL
jgi:mono/diheme cytochrome c family protein